MKKKVFISSILIIIIVTLIFIGTYIFLNYKSGKNVIVTVKTISNSYETEGYIVKNESVIGLSGGTFVRFYQEEGERISTNSLIASVYDRESDGNVLSEIQDIDEKLKNLNNEYVNLTMKDVVKIENYIDEDIDALSKSIYDGNFSDVSALGIRLKTLFNIKHAGKGDEEVEEKALLNERTSLEAKLSSAKYDIKSNMSGIFVGTTDGYENVVDFDKAKKYTVREFDELLKSDKTSSDKACKIVDNYSWKLMCKVPAEYVVNTTVGKRISMETESGEEIKGVIEYISEPEDDKCLITISSDRDFYGLGSERIINIKIIFSEYTGYVIPSKAFHFYEDAYGVFVDRGNSLIFKETEIVYEDGEYSVVNPNGNTELKLYDNVLIEGDLSEFYD